MGCQGAVQGAGSIFGQSHRRSLVQGHLVRVKLGMDLESGLEV